MYTFSKHNDTEYEKKTFFSIELRWDFSDLEPFRRKKSCFFKSATGTILRGGYVPAPLV